jgi:phage major head subunit gpT-like protein
MEITTANLSALFTGFDVIFQRGFEKPPSYYEKIATVVRSASRQTTYPWLGRTTKFREWLGARVIQALEAHSYTIVTRISKTPSASAATISKTITTGCTNR